MPHRPPRILPTLLLLSVIILGGIRFLSTLNSSPTSLPPSAHTPAESEPQFGLPVRWGVVERAVDGDTLLLVGGERVRLLGVDTPETKDPRRPPEPFGPEASEFTGRLVAGKTVRLEFDIERFDRYGRTLAYVYVDDIFLNEAIILAGFSSAQLQYPYRNDMKRRFSAAERIARQNRVGMWSSTFSTPAPLGSP